MFRSISLLSLAIFATIGALAQIPGVKVIDHIENRNAKMDTVYTVPHLAVNDEWQSLLFFRNDSTSTVTLELQIFNADGNLTQVALLDDFNNEVIGHTFQINLIGFQNLSLWFSRTFSNDRSVQAYVFSPNPAVALEASYHNYNGNEKLTSVGVNSGEQGQNFLMNIDHRTDPVSQNQQFRAMAVTNVLDTACSCRVYLYDDGASGANLSEGPYDLGTIELGGSEKWLGTTYDLFNDIDQLLPQNFGYLELNCSNPVSALGLGFEQGTSIVSSVPINYFETAKTKDKVRKPTRQPE